MNIVEYRALKLQEEESANAQTATPNTEPKSEIKEETTEVTPTQPIETGEAPPKTITIEGIGEVDIDELKNGYLRQSDYTKKTQELADNQRQLDKVAKLYEAVQANPERAEQLAQEFGVPTLDPRVDYVTELQDKYHDLLLEKDIAQMSAKYEDFDANKVLPIALEKQIENLEDAYLLYKAQNPTPAPTVDVESIKEQIRQDLLKELELERNTHSLITSGNGAPVTDNQPVLSDEELKVARNLRLSPQEYAKWRDK